MKSVGCVVNRWITYPSPLLIRYLHKRYLTVLRTIELGLLLLDSVDVVTDGVLQRDWCKMGWCDYEAHYCYSIYCCRVNSVDVFKQTLHFTHFPSQHTNQPREMKFMQPTIMGAIQRFVVVDALQQPWRNILEWNWNVKLVLSSYLDLVSMLKVAWHDFECDYFDNYFGDDAMNGGKARRQRYRAMKLSGGWETQLRNLTPKLCRLAHLISSCIVSAFASGLVTQKDNLNDWEWEQGMG